MKAKTIFSFILLIGVLISCEKEEESSDTLNLQLPTEFPLEVGNAWVYERTFNNGTSFYDTLYITGTYEDYFIYSWNPGIYGSLVKNENNKLLNCGYINQSETVIYNSPDTWLIYDTIGTIIPPIDGYNIDQTDSVKISTTMVQYSNNNFHSYHAISYAIENFVYDSLYKVYNSVGIYSFETFGNEETKIKLINTFHTNSFNKEFYQTNKHFKSYDMLGRPID
jgi:hypothetical protein